MPVNEHLSPVAMPQTLLQRIIQKFIESYPVSVKIEYVYDAPCEMNNAETTC